MIKRYEEIKKRLSDIKGDKEIYGDELIIEVITSKYDITEELACEILSTAKAYAERKNKTMPYVKMSDGIIFCGITGYVVKEFSEKPSSYIAHKGYKSTFFKYQYFSIFKECVQLVKLVERISSKDDGK